MKIGERLPYFELPAATGETFTLNQVMEKSCILVIFISNACPYVQAYAKRIQDLVQHFYEDNMGVIMVNSRSSQSHPSESLEAMKEFLVQHSFKHVWYLKDEEANLASQLGAKVTPEAFLFNSKRELVYQGAIDDAWDQPNLVTRIYLEDAIEYTLDGLEVDFPETEAIGCQL